MARCPDRQPKPSAACGRNPLHKDLALELAIAMTDLFVSWGYKADLAEGLMDKRTAREMSLPAKLKRLIPAEEHQDFSITRHVLARRRVFGKGVANCAAS